MKITVKLYGVFRNNRFKEEIREYPNGCKIKDVLCELAFSGPLLGAVAVNDLHVSDEHVLSDGDILMIVPLLDGG